MGRPARADVRDADDWWGTLTDEKRVSTHRWLSGKGKMPPPEQPEVLFGLDVLSPPADEVETATEETAEDEG